MFVFPMRVSPFGMVESCWTTNLRASKNMASCNVERGGGVAMLQTSGKWYMAYGNNKWTLEHKKRCLSRSKCSRKERQRREVKNRDLSDVLCG